MDNPHEFDGNQLTLEQLNKKLETLNSQHKILGATMTSLTELETEKNKKIEAIQKQLKDVIEQSSKINQTVLTAPRPQTNEADIEAMKEKILSELEIDEKAIYNQNNTTKDFNKEKTKYFRNTILVVVLIIGIDRFGAEKLFNFLSSTKSSTSLKTEVSKKTYQKEFPKNTQYWCDGVNGKHKLPKNKTLKVLELKKVYMFNINYKNKTYKCYTGK